MVQQHLLSELCTFLKIHDPSIFDCSEFEDSFDVARALLPSWDEYSLVFKLGWRGSKQVEASDDEVEALEALYSGLGLRQELQQRLAKVRIINSIISY